MKNTLKACCLFLTMQAAPGFADSGYYIEVGQDTTQEEAAAQWKTLVERNKTLLGHLTYYPKAVFQAGVAVNTRIQAGPIPTKAKAQKICARLFTNAIPCFVIEGLDAAPASEMSNLSEQAEGKPPSLPWLAQEATNLPWLNSDRKGQVQVAEAIRVPLSEGNDAATIKPLNPTFKVPSSDNQSNTKSATTPGWLTIDTFPNEDVALSFWEEVHSALPKNAAHLHVRVMKPLMTQQQSTASLAVGPFTDSAEATAFCDSIQAKERGLACNYDGGASATKPTHGDGYNNRRIAEARKHFQQNPPADVLNKQYWVQVLSAPNQLEALHQWEEMKAGNSDLLNGMRSSVSTSADHNAYVVRVGPVATNDDAIAFCTKLQGRGIKCRVLLYSVGP